MTDSTLNKLWRQALLIIYYNRCGICGKEVELQCHHIIKRRNKILKYNLLNGIPLCRECHAFAHTGAGRRKVDELQTPENLAYLDKYERMTYKQYKFDNRLSDKEFMQKHYDILKEVINGSR